MDRIDMSLDDIIKQNRKDKKKQLQAVRGSAVRGRGRGRGQAVRGRGGVHLQTQGRMKAFRSRFGTSAGYGARQEGASVRGKFSRRGRVAGRGARAKTGASPMNRQSQNRSQGIQRNQRNTKGVAARRKNTPAQRQNQQLISTANKRKAQARKSLLQAGKAKRQQQFGQRRGINIQTQVIQGRPRRQMRGGKRNFNQTQSVESIPQRTRRWRRQPQSSGPLPAHIMTVSVSNPTAETQKPVRINRQGQIKPENGDYNCNNLVDGLDPEIQAIIKELRPRFRQDFNLHKLVVDGNQTASTLSERFHAVRAVQRGGGPRKQQRQRQSTMGRTVVMM